MVNLPAKAGDTGSDTGRFSCVKALAEGQLSCREVLALQKKKKKTILVKAKMELREYFPCPMQGNIPPQKRGVMSECSATLVLQDITADT